MGAFEAPPGRLSDAVRTTWSPCYQIVAPGCQLVVTSVGQALTGGLPGKQHTRFFLHHSTIPELNF